MKISSSSKRKINLTTSMQVVLKRIKLIF